MGYPPERKKQIVVFLFCVIACVQSLGIKSFFAKGGFRNGKKMALTDYVISQSWVKSLAGCLHLCQLQLNPECVAFNWGYNTTIQELYANHAQIKSKKKICQLLRVQVCDDTDGVTKFLSEDEGWSYFDAYPYSNPLEKDSSNHYCVTFGLCGELCQL